MRGPLRRVLVRGPSMAPTLADGDVVLVAPGLSPRPGDVVVVRWASRPDQLSVKRAVRPEGAAWHVLGDYPDASTDSRTLGPVAVEAVVIGRLWPRPGRQPRGGRVTLGAVPQGRPSCDVHSLTAPGPTAPLCAPPSFSCPEGTPMPVDTAARTTGPPTTAPPTTAPCAVPDDEEVFAAHVGGKLSVVGTVPLDSARNLSIAYTPGVARVSSAIAADPAMAATHTWASRLVVVVSDGTAVLGLGDIGPRAALPVMEGKSALFKSFAGLDSIPLVLDTTDVDEIVETLVRLRPSFGAVNLEDVSAPRCFELERKLIAALDCPVMHDDQHGTAIVVLAALRGAAAALSRDLARLRVVVSGAGAAGAACTEILLVAGIGDVTVLDSRGIIHPARTDLNPTKRALAVRTNPTGRTGGLAEALTGADVFLGLSSGQVSEGAVAGMAPDAIVLALSNPTPEIHPELACRYASVVATGRSDFPNQINNVLAFPGVFRGALDSGARRITGAMKLAAADAIVAVAAEHLSTTRIVPSPLDPRVAPAVAAAVAAAAVAEGVAGG